MKQRSDMNHPAIGARLNKNSCTFTVWAPFRKKVELVLEKGNKLFSMDKDELGYWTVELRDIQAGTGYFFRIDGNKKLPDPASRAQLQGVHGPSTAIADTFDWIDHDWKGLALGDMVIYELHVG